ncbi:transposase [Methanosarcina sp.]|uniref:transposase n=1 Tax=Methanosarcina sp. TaxID=2213 RepID=UPI003A1014DB
MGNSIHFEELSDAQWKYIRSHLPPQLKVRRKRINDRQTINGILYVLVTGVNGEICPNNMDPT